MKTSPISLLTCSALALLIACDRSPAPEESGDAAVGEAPSSAAVDKPILEPGLTSADTEVLKEKLTETQYYVAVEDGTEPAFQNEYWDNKAEGLYVDIISGKPLFASTHKFKSGTGWPSFYQPVDEDEIVEIEDRKFGMVRVEVRSKTGDTHLGHVFDDGPQPTGLRYCINSAALRFVAKEDLEAQGYGDYAEMFAEAE